jgi:hypothetical protein
MLALGIILIIAGAGSAIYGFISNNSWESQLSSLLSSGSVNPGTMWIIIGVVAIIIGIIIAIVGASKKKQQQ